MMPEQETDSGATREIEPGTARRIDSVLRHVILRLETAAREAGCVHTDAHLRDDVELLGRALTLLAADQAKPPGTVETLIRSTLNEAARMARLHAHHALWRGIIDYGWDEKTGIFGVLLARRIGDEIERITRGTILCGLKDSSAPANSAAAPGARAIYNPADAYIGEMPEPVEYPKNGSPEAIAHWEAVRAKMAAARQAGAPAPERKPALTLAEQANRQIARLEREIEEWRAIKAEASPDPDPQSTESDKAR